MGTDRMVTRLDAGSLSEPPAGNPLLGTQELTTHTAILFSRHTLETYP